MKLYYGTSRGSPLGYVQARIHKDGGLVITLKQRTTAWKKCGCHNPVWITYERVYVKTALTEVIEKEEDENLTPV